MGRVYGLPSEPGVLSAAGCRVFRHTGAKIPFVCRVAFDADADEGMATVTSHVTDGDGKVVIDPKGGESGRGAACTATYRTWVRLVHAGQPDPPKTPDVMLWDGPDGSVCAGEDPLPQIPFTALRGEVAHV